MTEWRTKYRIVSPVSLPLPLPLHSRLQRVKAFSHQTGCEEAELQFKPWMRFGCVNTFMLEDEVNTWETAPGEAWVGECRTLRPIGKYLELILTRVSFNLRPSAAWGERSVVWWSLDPGSDLTNSIMQPGPVSNAGLSLISGVVTSENLRGEAKKNQINGYCNGQWKWDIRIVRLWYPPKHYISRMLD